MHLLDGNNPTFDKVTQAASQRHTTTAAVELFAVDGSACIVGRNDTANRWLRTVRSRQLHIYRNVKKAASKREQSDARIDSAEHEQARQKVKVLVLAGKSAPKVIREDPICELLQIERM